MPAYRYQASNLEGKIIEGVSEADSERSMRTQLRNKGLFPMSIEPIQTKNTTSKTIKTKTLSAKHRLALTRELSSMLSAELPLDSALQNLINQSEHQHVKELMADVRAQVNAGTSLTNALKAHPRAFPELYIALVAAGEMSGKLPQILERMVDWLENQEQLKQKVIGAMTYPIVVMVLSFFVIMGLMIYVLPKIVGVFAHTKQKLPLLTEVLLSISHWLQTWWWTLIPLFWLLALLWRHISTQPELRFKRDQYLLKNKLVGGLVRGFNTSQFASTLSILLESGVPLLGALESASNTMPNHAMRQTVGEAIIKVREGASLAKSLALAERFPPMLIQMIANGEKTGRLNQMLGRAAKIESTQLERKLVLASSLLEPAMIVIMGGIVLIIVMAVLMPIIEINQLVK